MFRSVLSDGVFSGNQNELKVTSPSGLSVSVDTGSGWVQGFFFLQDSTSTLTCSAADASHDRIDSVVMHLDLVGNVVSLIILTGAPAVSPTAPALTRTTAVWEVELAQARVNANSSVVSSVTDSRSDPNRGGWASSRQPFKVVIHAHQPTTFPVGGVIAETDTLLSYWNSGTYAAPVWSPLGTLASSTLPSVLGPNATAGSAGVNTDVARSDHLHPVGGVGRPGLVPVGGVIGYLAITTDPAGYYLGDGRAVSRTADSTLFGVESTADGAGDGSTTFNIVDYRGRTEVGPDSMGTGAGAAGRLAANNTRGAHGGSETVTLATANLPVHNHPVSADNHVHSDSLTDNSHQHTAIVSGGAAFVGGATAIATTQNTSQTNSSVVPTTQAPNVVPMSINNTFASGFVSIGNTGSGTAFNNMSNYVVVAKIVKR